MISKRKLNAAALTSLSQRVLRTKSLHSTGGTVFGKRQTEENSVQSFAMVDEPGSRQAEAFRTLRASISLLNKEYEFRSFLFTSAIPSEGKTFTSLNFASSLARHGRRTLIIDADLREPSLNAVLLKDDAKEIPGLTDLLCGEIALGEALRHTVHENLFFFLLAVAFPIPLSFSIIRILVASSSS